MAYRVVAACGRVSERNKKGKKMWQAKKTRDAQPPRNNVRYRSKRTEKDLKSA
jgi:hypothetical protein